MQTELNQSKLLLKQCLSNKKLPNHDFKLFALELYSKVTNQLPSQERENQKIIQNK